jgi:GGDEF domain-containing protein
MGSVSALRSRRITAVVLGIWLLLWHAHSRLLGDVDLGPLFSRWAYVAILIGASVLCLWRAVVAVRARAAWALIGAGALAWALGDTYFTFALYDDPSPAVPSLADIGYLLLPPFVLAGIVLLLRAHARDLPRAQWADGVIVGLAVGALSAAVSFDTIVAHVSGSTAEIVTNLAYPIADVVLLAVIVGAVAGTGWRPDLTLWPLALGVVLFSVADSLYVVQVADSSFEAGGWLDMGWSFGIWLMGLAASQPPMSHVRAPAPDVMRPIAVPLAYGTTALALLVFGCLAGGLNPLAAGLAAACMIGVMARLLVTFGDYVNTLRGLQRDALSDPLTGAGNRRSLLIDLERGLDERRGLFVIVVDGVREFNEVLGRSAGDALLRRLAGRLALLAGPSALTYRTRACEFAVVRVLAPDEDVERTAHELAEGLGERLDGIDIVCTAAGVALGTDAHTVPAALRLADQRLTEQAATPQVA